MNHLSILFWSLICFFSANSLLAQSTESSMDLREIGIRFSGFDDFKMLYRRQVRPRVMNRHRFALVSLRVNRDSSTSAFDMGYSLGREFYKDIGEKVNFYHGPEGSLLFNYAVNKQNSETFRQLRSTFELGYVLGAQYVINPSFRVGMEIIPVLSVFHRAAKDSSAVSGVNFIFNSNFTLLTLTYRFQLKAKK